MKEKLTRKAINFDLDTKELLKHFKNTHQAYSAIKIFMKKMDLNIDNILDIFLKSLYLNLVQ